MSDVMNGAQDMTENDSESEASGSLIGTKQFWDDCYRNELSNFSCFGDTGDVWFGLTNTEKIVKWIANHVPKSAPILDVGCGNGYLAIELFKSGFDAVFGVDYSADAIRLCDGIARRELGRDHCVRFEVLDILREPPVGSGLYGRKFDCVVDKGTFDAICLMPDVDIDAVRRAYTQSVLSLMAADSVLVLMSCNSTKDELCQYFKVGHTFALIHEFESPKLSFGGNVGQQVTGIVLKPLL